MFIIGYETQKRIFYSCIGELKKKEKVKALQLLLLLAVQWRARIRGIGPATVRGLALISELIYGNPPSWKDPVKYSFAYGGKDGVPYPVNREAMDETIQILRSTIENAKRQIKVTDETKTIHSTNDLNKQNLK